MGGVIDRIPHRPPWLLVDRVVQVDRDRVASERRLSATDPLLSDGLPELLVLEALAQTAACLMTDGLGRHRGYLVAASGFEFFGRAQAGETLLLRATKTAQLGALHRFDGEAAVGERLVARGEMTFAVEAERGSST
jgi:3-hydroxymyristoyl/3-hydroxydecanoyl-(acyl carrier protein) dehydratase